jgi:hypothetical protein
VLEGAVRNRQTAQLLQPDIVHIRTNVKPLFSRDTSSAFRPADVAELLKGVASIREHLEGAVDSRQDRPVDDGAYRIDWAAGPAFRKLNRCQRFDNLIQHIKKDSPWESDCPCIKRIHHARAVCLRY